MKDFRAFSEAVNLQHHQTLNPKIWNGDHLRPDVREALLRFGEAWKVFAKIPDSFVRDVILVGGNSSYYYTDASDLDVHILIDKTELGYGPLVDEFLRDRKALWTLKHAVRIKGYPVEPYAQDISETFPQGQGVYSLRDDKWIQYPIVSAYDPADDPVLDTKIQHWSGLIDKIISDGRPIEDADKLKDRISEMRRVGIAAMGELSPENMVFKSMRNSGHLDRLTSYIKDLKDKSLSLE